VSNPVTQ